MGTSSVSPTLSNTKLYGIQINHIDSHKTPGSKYCLLGIKQMFVSKATISSNWLTLCCIDSSASLCSRMSDKCLEESSVNWPPPPSACKCHRNSISAADQLICMRGRRVDTHTHGFTVQIQLGRFLSVLSDRLRVNLCKQSTLIEQLCYHRHCSGL